ncbi:MAG: sulfurtransferase [Nitrospinota bacterium]|nr:MAG: sulfurtransferase [Nitrospinota bacterium]
MWRMVPVVFSILLFTMGSFTQGLAQQPAAGSPKTQLLLTVEELQKRLQDPHLRILDARPPREYGRGHIPGAVNLPVRQITVVRDGIPGMLAPQERIEAVLGSLGIKRESPVVIYDTAVGVRATRLFWALEYYGHPHVALLDGGFTAWQAAGLPVTTDVPPVQQTPYQASPDPDRLATAQWILEHLKATDVVLVDARSPAEFRGETAGRGIKAAGHIPGAVNINWVQNLTQTAPWKVRPLEELRKLYLSQGVTPDKTVVTYCRSGMRASHAYFVLRLLGYPRIRLYDGSWLEWGNGERFPVE